MAAVSLANRGFATLRIVVLAGIVALLACALPSVAQAEGQTSTSLTTTQDDTPTSIADAKVTPAKGPYVYTGDLIEPKVTVTLAGKPLNPNKDYDVSYSRNRNVGTATITVTGTGDYEGTAKGQFSITKASIATAVIPDIKDKAYTGSLITPTPPITFAGMKLKKDRDYTLAYKANRAVGTAKLTVVGKGNFTGRQTVSFEIVRASISKASVAKVSSKTYTGKSYKPTPRVTFQGKTLKKDKDYTLSYKSNKNAGTAKITIKGTGSFKGTKKVTFKISRVSLSQVAIGKVDSQTYTGSAIKPNPKVTFNGKTLKKGKDYKLSYDSNTKVGAAKVKVTGKGNFKGSSTQTFAIMQRSLTNPRASVSSIPAQTYTGSPIKPKPTVRAGGRTLTEGTDYKLSYSDNQRVGTAIIYIEGRGGYAGRIAETFQII